MHLAAFLQANLAPKITSVGFKSYDPYPISIRRQRLLINEFYRALDLAQHLCEPLIVDIRAQPFDGGIVLIHEVLSQADHFLFRPSGASAARLMLPVH